MKKILSLIFVVALALGCKAQTLTTQHPILDSAFSLAVWTVDHNTHNNVLEAGAGYGGEWTRDASINSWNAASLLRPAVAEHTLWSVTEDSATIGHQYWDKILWVTAAWNHYQVTGDRHFLDKAYDCSRNTMAQLESQCYDKTYGLFMGPAVFQDGIEAYPEPVYDPKKWDDSYVLHHPHSDSIRCLSTNIAYYEAYRSLSSMAAVLDHRGDARAYSSKAKQLKRDIVKNLYDSDHHRFNFLIDHQGTLQPYQEGLGVSLALLSDILPSSEAVQMVGNLYKCEYGLPSVSPSFPRNSVEKPGRHNMMIWPHINAFYANGCAHQGLWGEFYREMFNMARLAIINGDNDFYEIYTIQGEPSGGWQCKSLWDKKEHQTWCATGYLCMWTRQVFGISCSGNDNELTINPKGLADGGDCTLSGLQWRGCDITITLHGCRTRGVASATLNGKPVKSLSVAPNQGTLHFDITLE